MAALEDGNISEDGLDDENDDEDVFYNDAREIMEDLLDDVTNDRDTNEANTSEVLRSRNL